MRTRQEIQNILKDVQQRLDVKKNQTGVALHVPQDGYVEEDDWLNIIVAPDKPGVRAHQYVEALGEIERELQASGLKQVLLVPALAE